MSPNPLISILLITFNRPEETLALLQSIGRQADIAEYIGEVLVLNNHSDQSYEVVDAFIRNHKEIPIRMINSDENLGVARGRNFLIREAKYPLLLVLDDDVVFDDDQAISIAARLFDSPLFRSNNTAVITLNIHYFESGERQKNALPHKKYEKYKDKPQFLTPYFIGAAHLMKKELFEKTGYYPEDFFYGMEEYDLSYRIINAGYTLGYDNRIKILHKESPQGRVPSRTKLRMMWYNKSVVAWKYLPKKYFYSTAFMWSLQYLVKSGFDLHGFFFTFREILKIRKKISIDKISEEALKYLKETEARLWF